MPDKKNIIISTLIFILIVMFFPLKISSNLKYISDKTVKFSSIMRDIKTDSIPFLYKDTAGYYSDDLNETWSMDIKDGVVLLNDCFINYTRDEGRLNLIDFSGELKYSIESSGYPFSIKNRLFIIERDRKTLSEYKNGELLWTKTFNHIITVVDANSDFTAIGFVNGYFSVLNIQGKTFYEYEPGGSEVSIIYGVKISDDSEHIALVSGLSPQRFTIYEKRNFEYKPIYTVNMDTKFRRAIKMFIPSDNRSVFIEGRGGYYIVNINEKSIKFLDSDYALKNVEYMSDADLYMIHTGAENINNLKFVTLDFRELLNKEFIGSGVSVTTRGNSVYTVINESIIKLDIKE